MGGRLGGRLAGKLSSGWVFGKLVGPRAGGWGGDVGVHDDDDDKEGVRDAGNRLDQGDLRRNTRKPTRAG